MDLVFNSLQVMFWEFDWKHNRAVKWSSIGWSNRWQTAIRWKSSFNWIVLHLSHQTVAWSTLSRLMDKWVATAITLTLLDSFSSCHFKSVGYMTKSANIRHLDEWATDVCHSITPKTFEKVRQEMLSIFLLKKSWTFRPVLLDIFPQ